jgi:hypothetical protein
MAKPEVIKVTGANGDPITILRPSSANPVTLPHGWRAALGEARRAMGIITEAEAREYPPGVTPPTPVRRINEDQLDVLLDACLRGRWEHMDEEQRAALRAFVLDEVGVELPPVTPRERPDRWESI